MSTINTLIAIKDLTQTLYYYYNIYNTLKHAPMPTMALRQFKTIIDTFNKRSSSDYELQECDDIRDSVLIYKE